MGPACLRAQTCYHYATHGNHQHSQWHTYLPQMCHSIHTIRHVTEGSDCGSRHVGCSGAGWWLSRRLPPVTAAAPGSPPQLRILHTLFNLISSHVIQMCLLFCQDSLGKRTRAAVFDLPGPGEYPLGHFFQVFP